MRKLISLLLCMVLALSMSVSAFASTGSSFSDVPQNHWAYQYVERAANEGWVTGVGNGKFNPDGMVTGAEWYTMVARTFYADRIPNQADGGKWYSDKWYAPYMQVAEEHNFNMYYDDSTNQAVSERPLTRAEMAGVVFSIVSQKRDDVYLKAYKVFEATANTIPDLDSVDIQSNAYTAIVYSYAMGIITGVDDKGTFDGDGLMSRAQAAVVLCRMADVIETGVIPEGPAQPEQPEDTTEEPVTPPEEPEQPTETVEGPTEEEVYNKIIALKEQYPDGTPWGDDKTFEIFPTKLSTGEIDYVIARGCAAFTEMCQAEAFGGVAGTGKYPDKTTYESFDEIRVGDEVGYDHHFVIVLEKKTDSIIVAEGNFNGAVYWGREITREYLENQGFFVQSRYPQ